MTISLLLGCPNAWGFERTPYGQTKSEIDIAKIPRTAEEPETFWDFLKDRTRIGYGFEETYNSNLFLQDNNKQNEYISTLESEIFFADPRGALLYGLDWEVNAFHYHQTNVSAINQDVGAFFDYDPGGRYKFGVDYKLTVRNDLLFTPDQGDIIRRHLDGKFERTVSHHVNSKLNYALNETDSLTPQVDYDYSDLQINDDSGADRRVFKAIIDLDHDFKPGWTVFVGSEHQDIMIPGNKLKNDSVYAARLGTDYELTGVTDLKFLFKVERHEFQDGQSQTNASYSFGWNYRPGPRTTVDFTFEDKRVASFAQNRRQFRSIAPSGSLAYDLTPLTKLTLSSGYTRQTSTTEDLLPGSFGGNIKSTFYNIGPHIQWQIREKSKIVLYYSFSRSKTNDYTDHLIGFQLEAEL